MNQICKKYRPFLLTLVATVLAVTLTGCVQTVSATHSDITDKNGVLEPVYAVEIRDGSIWYMVKSTGCTSEKSFRLSIEKTADNQLAASLHRKKRDLCKAMPKYVTVELNAPELKDTGHNVVIQNPFVVKNLAKKKTYKKTT